MEGWGGGQGVCCNMLDALGATLQHASCHLPDALDATLQHAPLHLPDAIDATLQHVEGVCYVLFGTSSVTLHAVDSTLSDVFFV